MAATDELRRQGRAVRAPLAGLAALAARGVPDSPRRIGRAGDGDGAARGRARRHGLHLPRGDADPPRHPGGPEARRRPARPADRRPRRPHGGVRQRAGAARLADPTAQGEGAAGAGDDLPARRAPVAAAGRIGDRADLAQRAAAVGRDGRPAADAPRGGDRRRKLGHGGRRAVRPGRARGPARHAHRRAGGGDGGGARERTLPGGGRAARLAARPLRLRDRAGRPRPGLPGDPLRLLAAGRRRDRRPGQRPLLGAAVDQGPDRPARPAPGRIRR